MSRQKIKTGSDNNVHIKQGKHIEPKVNQFIKPYDHKFRITLPERK